MSDEGVIKALQEAENRGFKMLVQETINRVNNPIDRIVESVSEKLNTEEQLKDQKKDTVKIKPIEKINSLKSKITILGELFADEDSVSWYFCKGKQNLMIKSREFEDFVRLCLNDIECEKWVIPLVKFVDSSARQKATIPLSVRVAQKSDIWYIDHTASKDIVITPVTDEGKRDRCVTDKENEVCRRDRDSVTGVTVLFDNSFNFGIKDKEYPLFRTSSDRLPFDVVLSDIKYPNHNYVDALGLLDQQLNIPKEDLTLLKCLLPALLVPGIQKPIFLIRGSQGTGKSTIGRVIVNLIDPAINMIDGVPMPKHEKDLYLMAKNNLLVFIDNANKIENDMQDACCRLITGTSVQERQLYTNADLCRLKIQSGLIINAIDLSNLQSDFLERSILINTQDLKVRRQEAELINQRKEDAKYIRAALILILAKARAVFKSVTAPDFFRLTDFARWGLACAKVQGISEENYLKLLKQKSAAQQDETFDQSCIASPLLRFAELNNQWQGTGQELLNKLNLQEFGKIQGFGDKETIVIDYKSMPQKWPKDPAKLGKDLAYISKSMQSYGLTITKDRDHNGRVIKLEFQKKEEKDPSHPSRCHGIEDKKRDRIKNDAVTPVTVEEAEEEDIAGDDVD